jgi:hypothetical protein
MAADPPNDPRNAFVAIWVAISTLLAALVAAGAGVLTWAAGSSVPGAVLGAGVAFAGCLTLALAVINTLQK